MASFSNGSQEEIQQSLLIVEPNEVIRTGLSLMAETIPFVAAVIGCDDVEPAIQVISARGIDTMLLSARFGADRTEMLRKEAAAHGLKYLVTVQEGGQAPDHDALEMVTHGVLVLDSLTTESLTDALHRLARDLTVLPAQLLRSMLQKTSAPDAGRPRGFPALTSREQQVLSFLADGLSNKQIARRIAISEHGVKRHVASVLAKLNCPNRTQAVSYALQHGLLADSSQ